MECTTMASLLKAINDSASTVLETVSSTAQIVSKTVNTLGNSVDILDSFIEKHQRLQLIAHDNEMFVVGAVTKAETLVEVTKRLDKVISDVEKSNNLKAIYGQQEALYDAFMKAREDKRTRA